VLFVVLAQFDRNLIMFKWRPWLLRDTPFHSAFRSARATSIMFKQILPPHLVV
jgi:hypothetical protein